MSGILGAAPYAVYAAPNSEGAPSWANRTVSPGGPSAVPPPQDTTYLIYCDARCRRGSEVQILSEPPDGALRPRSSGGKPPPPDPASFTLGEIIWHAEVVPSPQVVRFTASTNLGDAYVTIHAPDRATFERVALELRRIN